jgi:ATP-dependent RNA helicase DeaD
MSQETPTITSFSQLNLSEDINSAITNAGYTEPSPIQALTIPQLLDGKDVVGQAQTGTGKTAAFAIPMLMNVDVKLRVPQVLVLAPTRELAIQVADSFKKYGSRIRGLKVLTIYGGQSYELQLRPLRAGVQVVVGTPGRVMDHLRKGTLKLDQLKGMVLDEADEMLKMGFRDDVEWILQQTPDTRQTALFSATMPNTVRNIARKYMNKAVEISTKSHTTAAETIRQRAYMVKKDDRLEAMTRLMEAEEESMDAILIFVRQKITTVDVSERLFKLGFKSAALNGDMAQNMRELTVNRFKKGYVKILVATEVAARGLDFDRISHVINYDPPENPDIYVHRIGRTGRAGKKGNSILFITKREMGFLRIVERATRQRIEVLTLPSTEEINTLRIAKFKNSITKVVESGKLGFYEKLLSEYHEESEFELITIAAAVARMGEKGVPLLFKATSYEKMKSRRDESRQSRFDGDRNERSRDSRSRDGRSRDSRSRDGRSRDERPSRARDSHRDDSQQGKSRWDKSHWEKSSDSKETPSNATPSSENRYENKRDQPQRENISKRESGEQRWEKASRSITREQRSEHSGAPLPRGMSRFKITVGNKDGILPIEIIKSMVSTSGIDNMFIGKIIIKDTFTLLDLPADMPERVLEKLADSSLKGKKLEFNCVETGNKAPRSNTHRKRVISARKSKRVRKPRRD